jgi:hypothetical protein
VKITIVTHVNLQNLCVIVEEVVAALAVCTPASLFCEMKVWNGGEINLREVYIVLLAIGIDLH